MDAQKCQAGRKTLRPRLARASRCGSSRDPPPVPKAVSLGLRGFRTCAQPAAHPFKISEQQQVKTLTTDQRILLIHQPAKALTMSAPTTKTFGKSTRSVPHATEKAQKWYPAEDEAKPRKVRWMHSFSGLILGRRESWERQTGWNSIGIRVWTGWGYKNMPRGDLCGGRTGTRKHMEFRPTRGGWWDNGGTAMLARSAACF